MTTQTDYEEIAPGTPVRATFAGQRTIHGALQRVWTVNDGQYRLTGEHTGGPWWSVYVMKRTPDGYAPCGMSHACAGQVPGGRGRDNRIVNAGCLFIITTYNHDADACAVCTSYKAEVPA